MLSHWAPQWLRDYQRAWFSGDLLAGFIVTVMLIPQSLAYALLAGLPPQYGLYASILPPIAYAFFGTSMALAVGPVAVVSLMTADALMPLAEVGSAQYVQYAIYLGALSGLMLLLAGFLRLGSLANLLSHPVISGFINSASILIVLGQIKPLLDLRFHSDSALGTLLGIVQHWQDINAATAAVGVTGIISLVLARRLLRGTIGKLVPMVLLLAATATTAHWTLDTAYGVQVVGVVPAGFPSLHWVIPGWDALSKLWVPAALISLVGTVEGVSVARSLAQKKRQRIDANREFLGLGAANFASATLGGYPVSGGFSRSVVNLAVGANTPLAGVVSALLMVVVLLEFTSWFYYLPTAVLAATIIVAVSTLIDFSTLKRTWHFDKADSFAFLAVFFGVLTLGIDHGIVLGVALSLATLVYKTSRPHIAAVGLVPGTEHFRNIKRFAVETLEDLLVLRIDESIYFGNAVLIEQRVNEYLQKNPKTKGLLLVMSAVNRVDSTGLEMLESLQEVLTKQKIELLLAEVKGPVMDGLKTTGFFKNLKQKPYLSTSEAFRQWKAPTLPQKYV